MVMEMIKMIRILLAVIALLSIFASGFLLYTGIRKKSKKEKTVSVILMVVFIICMIMSFVFTKRENAVNSGDYTRFDVTSEDLKDGKWDVRISHDKGEDLSPQLKWEVVKGASGYAIYMIDPDGSNWLHMITETEENELSTGEVADYIGPYPPGGIHTYEVYVFALKEMKKLPGTLNVSSGGINEIIDQLDRLNDGSPGNILGTGVITGDYPGKAK